MSEIRCRDCKNFVKKKCIFTNLELDPNELWRCSENSFQPKKQPQQISIVGDSDDCDCTTLCSSQIRQFETGVTKPTNPKDALGIKKVPLHCVPCGPLLEVGLAMMEGGRKYGTHNYRAIGVRASTYFNATMRHLIAWWEGEDIDPDSSVHHVIKAIACLMVLRDSMLMNNCEDDRPVQYPDKLPIEYFNKQAEQIIEKYPDCAKPFLKKKNGGEK